MAFGTEHEQAAREGSGDSSEVESEVRRLYRRRLWAWVAGGSLVALVAYTIVGVAFFQSLTGALEAISVVPLFVFLALVPLGLVIVVVETVRLHHYEAFLVRAQSRVYRYPPWHWLNWLISLVAVVALATVPLVYLPNEVDAVAYLTGVGGHVTFVPTSYHRVYTRGGYYLVTDGVLEPGGESGTWPAKVPLHRSFTVRPPVWRSPGAFIVAGTGDALGRLALGVVFNLLAILGIPMFVWSMRRRLAHRRAWWAARTAATG